MTISIQANTVKIGERAGRLPPFSDLMANAARFAPDGADVHTYSLQCWSLVHGLAMLFLDGQVPFDRDLVASVIDVQSLLGVREAVPPA